MSNQLPKLIAYCFVGLEGKFVMTKKFPDTEEYAGLHGMLEDWIGFDEYLVDGPLEIGHYELEFDLVYPEDSRIAPYIYDSELNLVSWRRVNE